MNSETYLRAGDVIAYAGQICRVLRVNECAAVVAVPRPARKFTTIFGKTVTLQPAPKHDWISANSCVPIIERKNP